LAPALVETETADLAGGSKHPVERRGSPQLLELLDRAQKLDKRIERETIRLERLKDDRQELRKQLSAKIKVGFWRIGPFTIRRTISNPKPTIDAWAAIEAGDVDKDVLLPYMRARESSERWTLKRTRSS